MCIHAHTYLHRHINPLTFLPQNCAAAPVQMLATMPQSFYNDLLLSRENLQTIDKVSEVM